jgi:hypothetical protein
VAVAPELIALGNLLALIILIGILWAYRYTLGAVLLAASGLLGTIRLPGFLGGGRVLGFAADEILKADHSIRNTLGTAITFYQDAWNHSVSYFAYAVHWWGKELAALSHDTAQAVEGLHVTSVTNVYRKVNTGLAARVGALAAAVAALKHAGITRVEKITNTVTHKVTVIERAVAVPDIGAIPRAIPTIKELERAGEAALERAKALARRFGPAALLATVVTAVARLGFGWVRCSKVGRTGKQLCGMNESLLESLLADTLLVVGTLSLVEFSREMIAVTEEATPLVRRFWRAA